MRSSQEVRERVLSEWHLVIEGRVYTFEELRPIVWHWLEEEKRHAKGDKADA